VPVVVNTASGVSALSGRTVVAVAAGYYHSLAQCSDGTVAAWGNNSYGQLGDNTATQRKVPVAASTTPLAAGERFTRIMGGSSGYHTLALVAGPAPEIQIAANSASIPDGGSQDLGNVPVGSNSSLVFTVTNRGAIALTGLGITIDGTDAEMFTVTANPVAPVSSAGGSTTFTVRFAPTTAGMKTAALHIASNDPDENPFDITLTGNLGAALQAWRQTHFGSPSNTGDGADLNDFEKDGIPNLVEFAFGLHPKQNSAGLLPQPQKIGDNFVVTFTQPTGVSGVIYGAEWSTTLLPGSWIPITDTGTGTQHVFSVPIGTKQKLFVRLTVVDPTATPLQAWRQSHFGSTANSGDGADLNDFDRDGIPNLVEFAFGLHPKQNSAGLLPRPQKVGNNFVFSFTQPAGVSGITYGAEWSTTLQEGSWTAITDTGNTGASPPQHTFSVPVGTNQRIFMRIKVTNP
jgi:hypothetical protein